MKLLGLPVSAIQYTCLLFVKVLIQNSPLLVLFMSDTFPTVKFTEWMMLIFCQSSIISLMLRIDSRGRWSLLLLFDCPFLFPHLCFLPFVVTVLLPVGCFSVVVVFFCCFVVVFVLAKVWGLRSGLSSWIIGMLCFRQGICLSVLVETCCRIFGSFVSVLFAELVELGLDFVV